LFSFYITHSGFRSISNSQSSPWTQKQQHRKGNDKDGLKIFEKQFSNLN